MDPADIFQMLIPEKKTKQKKHLFFLNIDILTCKKEKNENQFSFFSPSH